MSCEHKKAFMFHDNTPSYCPDCGQYIDGGEVVVTKDKEPKTFDQLKKKLTPEIIQRMVELAKGFGWDHFDNPYYIVKFDQKKWFIADFKWVHFPLLLHRAVEGWNKRNEKVYGLYIEVKRKEILYYRFEDTIHKEKHYKFKDYIPCHLTACEMAILDCLCRVLR